MPVVNGYRRKKWTMTQIQILWESIRISIIPLGKV